MRWARRSPATTTAWPWLMSPRSSQVSPTRVRSLPEALSPMISPPTRSTSAPASSVGCTSPVSASVGTKGTVIDCALLDAALL